MQAQLKPISAATLAVCSALFPAFVAAQAVSNQSVSASYTVSGSTFSDSGATISSSTPYVFQPSPYGYMPGAGVTGNASTGQISSIAQAGGDTSGRPDGNGGSINAPFSDAISTVTYRATYTNDTASTQTYNFNFLIDKGALGINSHYGAAPSFASFAGSLRINNNLVWNTEASLSYTNQAYGVPANFSQSGVDIGYTQELAGMDGNITIDSQLGVYMPAHDLYTFSGYHGSVSLGTLAAGQSVDVEYTFQNIAKTDGFFWYGGAVSFVNDPFGAEHGNSANVPGISVTVAAVPEPETVAMLTAGLGLLAVRARRRKATAQ